MWGPWVHFLVHGASPHRSGHDPGCCSPRSHARGLCRSFGFGWLVCVSSSATGTVLGVGPELKLMLPAPHLTLTVPWMSTPGVGVSSAPSFPSSSPTAPRSPCPPSCWASWALTHRRKPCASTGTWTCSPRRWRMAGTASPSRWWSGTVGAAAAPARQQPGAGWHLGFRLWGPPRSCAWCHRILGMVPPQSDSCRSKGPHCVRALWVVSDRVMGKMCLQDLVPGGVCTIRAEAPPLRICCAQACSVPSMGRSSSGTADMSPGPWGPNPWAAWALPAPAHPAPYSTGTSVPGLSVPPGGDSSPVTVVGCSPLSLHLLPAALGLPRL